MKKLDPTDKKILELLQEDARMTIKELSAKLDLSTTPVFERIKRLEKQGIIDRYVAILNPEKLGKKLNAFVLISLKEHSKGAVEGFGNQVVTYPEILECHHVIGDADFMLKVVVEDIEAYNLFILDKLSTVPNVGKLQSRFSLSVRKRTHALNLR